MDAKSRRIRLSLAERRRHSHTNPDTNSYCDGYCDGNCYCYWYPNGNTWPQVDSHPEAAPDAASASVTRN